jgi:hypothetical protein
MTRSEISEAKNILNINRVSLNKVLKKLELNHKKYFSFEEIEKIKFFWELNKWK